MLLYHGTSGDIAEKAWKEGLHPRGENKSLWDEFPSHPDAVYLTTAYATYFALIASDRREDKNWGILEVETENLNPWDFGPDEDFLEWVGRNKDGVKGGMAQRTRWYKRKLREYAGTENAEKSLNILGNCLHFGDIPPDAIVRCAIVDWKRTKPLMFAVDPSITPMNYAIKGAYYRAITSLIFNNDWDGSNMSDFDNEYLEELRNKVDRNGITIFDERN